MVCIDKSSSAELSESINSMYNWYKNSKVCLVYMADVHCHVSLDERADKATTSTASPENKIKEINYLEKYPNFGTSRWFLRGWTLQELIVPRNVVFYDNDWRVIAKIQDIARVVERFTEIPVPVLLSGVTESYCVAEKKRNGHRSEEPDDAKIWPTAYLDFSISK
jgi:hypothetical protein